MIKGSYILIFSIIIFVLTIKKAFHKVMVFSLKLKCGGILVMARLFITTILELMQC